jgi:hypothetical protein
MAKVKDKVPSAKLPSKKDSDQVIDKPKNPVGAVKKWTDERIKEEADFMLEAVKDDDVITMLELYAQRDYEYKQACEWEKHHEYYRQAKSKVRQIIGSRRERGALRGEYNQHIVAKSMGMYDPGFKQHEMDMKKSAFEEVAQALIIQGVRGLKANDNSNN